MIVYLDPDIRLYAPITEVFEAVREHGLVLNPHNTEPMPRDGRWPNEQDILIAGAYNLGFIGLGPLRVRGRRSSTGGASASRRTASSIPSAASSSTSAGSTSFPGSRRTST